MKKWLFILAFLMMFMVIIAPVSAYIQVTHIPAQPDTSIPGYSPVIFTTYELPGIYASLISIDQYSRFGSYIISWDYFETVPVPLPPGATRNTDSFRGYYNVQFTDLLGPNAYEWYVDEQATYQNYPGMTTWVNIVPELNREGMAEYYYGGIIAGFVK